MTKDIAQYIIGGGNLTPEEVVSLAKDTNKESLYELSHQLTSHFCGSQFDSCSIINAKSGNCSENCKWCAQSQHYNTNIEHYPLVTVKETIRHAKANAADGIKRFSLVTSGRKVNKSELENICAQYSRLRKEVNIRRCASLGLLTQEDMNLLRKSGVETYHCNIETAPSFFSELCNTHSIADKIRTIKAAQEAGLKVCSGGIIGMGETLEQRIEMAFTLKHLNVFSIPINVLHPIAGTPLAEAIPLSDDDILTTIALFRIINPTVFLRFSGGRSLLSPQLQRKALYVGINAAIMGNLLTTIGSSVQQDKLMIKEMNYEF